MSGDRCHVCGDPHATDADAHRHDREHPTSDCPEGCWCEGLCWAQCYRTSCWQIPGGAA